MGENNMTKNTQQSLENAKKFRSQLNGFYDLFKNDNNNLDALKYAIYIEDLIFKSNYHIYYDVPHKGENKGKITRAVKIVPKEKGMKQGVRLIEQFGHLVSHDSLFKVINKYQFGKIIYNKNVQEIGIGRGYYQGNDKTKMRFKVEYAKLEEGAISVRTNDWYEESCLVFESKQDLLIYVENTKGSDPMINSVTDALEFKLGILKYKGQ
jgi:hypothetical protein